MTRENKRAVERRQTDNFMRSLFGGNDAGVAVESRDEPEPDIQVHGVRLPEIAGEGIESIYVELTEYHPPAWGHERFKRSDVDSRWDKELLPAIEAARHAKPAMKNIEAQMNFKEARLPSRRSHQVVARELIRAVEAVIPRLLPGKRLEVCFQPSDAVSKLPTYAGNMTFLAKEDFPIASEHLDALELKAHDDWDWPPWSCPRMIGGWNSPSADEFRQILASKEEKAKRYDTRGLPLWLLIVAELANDRESHVFPRAEDDLVNLREQIAATGFDFARGPFKQVWLHSEFTEHSIRLYPES